MASFPNIPTPKQITTYIKKELQNKYPSITKLSVAMEFKFVTVMYEGGCNPIEMQKFTDDCLSLCRNNDNSDYVFKQKIMTIGCIKYDISKPTVSAYRSYNKSQAQIILDLIQGFSDANNKAVSLDLSQSSYDNGWMLAYNQDKPRQVIIEAGQGYNNTPGLNQALKPDSYIFEKAGGCVTVQSLKLAITRAIDF